MTKIHPFVLVFTAGIALGGCATPNQFLEPIAAVSGAAATAATSFDALNADSTAQMNAIRAEVAIRRGRVFLPSDTCNLDSANCIPLVKDKGDTAGEPLHETSLMPDAAAYFGAVKSYTKALDDIEKADSTPQVQAAFGSALSAAAGIAGAANLPAGAIITAANAPLTSLAGWGYGQYQNTVKLAALKKATAAANPVFQHAASALKVRVKLANDAHLTIVRQALSDRDKAFTDKPTPENLQAEIDAAETMNRLLMVKTPDLMANFADAHQKLTDALDKPEPDLTELWASIATLVQQAQNVRDVITALTPAKKPQP